ncbi:unnamed protein product [Phytophthora lilii]|uniref:RxLR effector protein n=1 Tax=Phytophthora lilii TaxID=2077276 RepID=A0A9W6XCQ1_9STRA|nr:unnamed protein product [Phytophthora lilii]
MCLRHVILAVLTVICFAGCAVSTEPKNATTSNWKPLLPALSSAAHLNAVKHSKEARSSHLRKLDVKQREDKPARPDLKTDEERVNTMNVVGMIGNAAKEKVELKLWLSLNFTPEKVKKMLNVISKEDANYKRYSRYFFKYYVKNLDAPISHLPEKTIEDIMQARLYEWLGSKEPLTPPQVFSKLGLTGSWDSARGQPNYKYFDQYLKMWGGAQVREYYNA